MGTIMLSDQVPTINGIPTAAHKRVCDHGSCDGRVWIFYSDANRTSQWGIISKNGINEDAENILCQQLGYNTLLGIYVAPPLRDNPPIWLTEVNCKGGENNILECNSTLCEVGNDCYNHSSDLTLSCSNSEYNIHTVIVQ